MGRHKEHKHKKHKHKEHKHKKDKKHKHRERDEKPKDVSNPLSSLLKEMTPDSSSSEPVKAKPVGSSWSGDLEDREDNSYTSTLAPVHRVAHAPSYPTPQDHSSQESEKIPDFDQSPGIEQPHQDPDQGAEDES